MNSCPASKAHLKCSLTYKTISDIKTTLSDPSFLASITARGDVKNYQHLLGCGHCPTRRDVGLEVQKVSGEEMVDGLTGGGVNW